MSIVAATASTVTVSRPIARSAIPIFEVARGSVTRPAARIRPLGAAQSNLGFTAWAFFHAAAKTELARSFTAAKASRHGLFLAALNSDLLAWDLGNLRVQKGGAFSRKDASRSYLAGRFGEAIAYLFMIRRGYIYWDHLPSLIERAMNRAQIQHTQQLQIARGIYRRLNQGPPREQPDFVFETAARDVALLESKGSFVNVDRPSNIKPVLRDALGQLANWPTFIRPRPQKAFAVGTFLREVGDPSQETSLVAFVDPEEPPRRDPDEVPLPEDWIRRGNYGAWLIGMGFAEAGGSLRSGEPHAGRVVRLPVIEVGKTPFAFVIDGIDIESEATAGSNGGQDHLLTGITPLAWWCSAFLSRGRPRVLGIEVDTLRTVERVIHEPADPSLLQLQGIREGHPAPVGEIAEDGLPDWLEGSLMPDGTLYGSFQVQDSRFPATRTEVFRL